ncbi:MAG TPA: YicC/YloC family endoribonuclease [Vicinamibacterales bacterium]|jgi:uncharacterized protein (TIGR00255 family)|nr:YicC/YloC family endoribonuclease [Vicinamibacterales bacterium]|tara:strand:- start:1176 stop:2117 length:942 start_codon:yes stop_codon:yes gene_type:complete
MGKLESREVDGGERGVMIRSMTGFASVEAEHAAVTLRVTLRSVNHRHLDLQVRLPPSMLALEPQLRALVQSRLARGRLELAVSATFVEQPTVEVELNESLVGSLAAALERVRAEGLSIGGLTAGDLLRLPHAVTVRERSGDSEVAADPEVVEAASSAVSRALDELIVMRTCEGEYLAGDLDARCGVVRGLVGQLEASALRGQAALEARLTERVRQLAVDPEPAPGLVAQEVVKCAARSDVNEEIARMQGHLSHWRTIADDDEACGRRLDFLLQEMNREVNTIGSKAEGLEVSELIVSAKAELERLREQVQNVE